jgi:hypothetical protein
MNVCVAFGALGADLLEHQVRVALRACDLSMHSPQRVVRLVVIELGIRPNRLPVNCGVTVLTGGGDRTMRIGHFRLRPCYLRAGAVGQHMKLQATKRGRHTNRYCKYPPKTIQRVSPPSPKGARREGCEPLRYSRHRQPTHESKLLEREFASLERSTQSRGSDFSYNNQMFPGSTLCSSPLKRQLASAGNGAAFSFSDRLSGVSWEGNEHYKDAIGGVTESKTTAHWLKRPVKKGSNVKSR